MALSSRDVPELPDLWGSDQMYNSTVLLVVIVASVGCLFCLGSVVSVCNYHPLYLYFSAAGQHACSLDRVGHCSYNRRWYC